MSNFWRGTLDIAFRRTLILPGMVLMSVLAAFVVVFDVEKALGYTGLCIYTLLSAATIYRKGREIFGN